MDRHRDIVRRGYDSCATNYRDTRELFQNTKHLEDLARRLDKGARILDLGCGSGVPVDTYFLERGLEVTGVDISPEQVRLAQERLPGGKFMQGDMSTIDFPRESFDAVVSFYAIFHIPREEHADLLRRIQGLLRGGGYLLATMGSGEWEGTEEDFHGARMFWSHYDREKNLRIVQETGFSIISEEIDKGQDEKHLVLLAQKPLDAA